MSVRVYESTSAALKALRKLSYDDDAVLMEAMMSPLLEVVNGQELRECVALESIVVPRLRRLLERPSRGSSSSSDNVLNVLFGAWCSRLTDAEGKPLQEPFDPFSRRAKWSLSTTVFAALISRFDMEDVLHEKVVGAPDRSKEAMKRELSSQLDHESMTKLLAVFSESKYIPRVQDRLELTSSQAKREALDSIDRGVEPLTRAQRFLRGLVELEDPSKIETKLKAMPREDVLEIIPTVLCSKDFDFTRSMLLRQEQFVSTAAEREVIALLNRITSSSNQNMSGRTMLKLASDLVWPALVTPESTYRRLLHTAITSSSQASITIGTLKLVPSFGKAKRSEDSAPYLLNALIDVLDQAPSELSSNKCVDAMNYVCYELFSRTSGEEGILDPNDGLFFTVLPILTRVSLSEADIDQFHIVQFALNILKRIITVEDQTDVSVLVNTFPEGTLLSLARVIDWCHSQRMVALQTLATSLTVEISKALGKWFVDNPPSAEITEGLRMADEIAEIEVEWDTRLAIEPVMSMFRTENSSVPAPRSVESKDATAIAVDFLKLCRADARDRMLVDLLQAFQNCDISLTEFRKSLLVACASVLPSTTTTEFARIAHVGLPTILQLRQVSEDGLPTSFLVLDVLCHTVIFAVQALPQRVFALCRHFAHLASELVNEAKQKFKTDAAARLVVRGAFMFNLKVLCAFDRAPKTTESQSCEILLVSSSLESLQTLISSPSHQKWAKGQIESLPKTCVSRHQLQSALDIDK